MLDNMAHKKSGIHIPFQTERARSIRVGIILVVLVLKALSSQKLPVNLCWVHFRLAAVALHVSPDNCFLGIIRQLINENFNLSHDSKCTSTVTKTQFDSNCCCMRLVQALRFRSRCGISRCLHLQARLLTFHEVYPRSTNSYVDSDTIRILVATDSHVGYEERDAIRKDDSWKSFDEIMQLAKSQDVGTCPF